MSLNFLIFYFLAGIEIPINFYLKKNIHKKKRVKTMSKEIDNRMNFL